MNCIISHGVMEVTDIKSAVSRGVSKSRSSAVGAIPTNVGTLTLANGAGDPAMEMVGCLSPRRNRPKTWKDQET